MLVTGCTGFLGSWLTRELVDREAEVVGLVRDWRPDSELVRSGLLERIITVTGDIVDYELLERLLAEYEIEFIFHLAAQTIVSIANRAPLSTFETNIKGTWVLLEAARRNPTVRGVVIASSDKAYGTHEQLPYQEDFALRGQHPYDVSKSCADLIARAYATTYALPLAVTRLANIYGGGDLNWNRLIPGTIRSVIRGHKPIIRSDGTFERDYLYVKDAVRGYLLLASRLTDPEICGQAFNFGLDQPVGVLETVQAIIRLVGKPQLEPIILDQAHNEIPDQYLDASKARSVLGWEPNYSLEQGLVESIEWYTDYLDDR